MRDFDSDEEKYMSWYLDELKKAGYINSFIFHPEAYVLSDSFFYEYDKCLKIKKKKIIVQEFVEEHIYSADFLVIWNECARGIFFNTFDDRINVKKIPFVANNNDAPYSVIEVKADFSKYNMIRVFSLNQRWVMQRFGVYVQKAIVSNKTGIFKTTFTPNKFLLCDKIVKLRKLHYKPRTLAKFVVDYGKNSYYT